MVPERDVRKAAASDDLADALDYSAVAETIAAVLREGKFRLIETAAERVAGRLLADFPLSWLRLELRKPITSAPAPHATPVTPAPAPAYTAVITIERRAKFHDHEGFSTARRTRSFADHVKVLPAQPTARRGWGWRGRRCLL